MKTLITALLKPPHLGAIALLGFLLSPLAGAHPRLEFPLASAGTPYRATFIIGHGCAGSPTREVSVRVPEGVSGARPVPKPGWTLRIEREALARPQVSHGREVRDAVRQVTWTARSRGDMLLNEHADEFVIHANLPGQAGVLAWPVLQVCEQGQTLWGDLPAPGRRSADLAAPAPLLEVMPSAGTGHAGHH